MDAKGLGDLCKSCREYVAGSLSEKNLPKPEKAANKIGTGNNIIDEYREVASQ